MTIITLLAVLSLAFTIAHAATRARVPLWPAVLVLGLIHLIAAYGTG